MKNIKWSRIIIIVIVILIIGFIINIVTSFYGNPVTAAIATSKIQAYVDKTYPNNDFEVPKANYNFKFEEYVSHIQSKTSADTRFSVAWSRGRINDSYEGDVVKRYTTYERIQHEFSKAVEDIIVKEFPYETSILFVDLGKAEIGLESLMLDMPLDINHPPLPAELTIYILSNETSYEFLSARLLELYEIMQKHQIPINMYSIVIEEPMPEGEKAIPGGESIYLLDFPTENIESVNLIETMKEHQMIWENAANKEKD